jgi:hypothetical protein
VEGTVEYLRELAVGAFLTTKFTEISTTLEVVDEDIYAYLLCEKF